MTPSDLTGLPDNILRKMVEEARAEAARQALLVQRYEPAYLGLPHVVRERDEAREEVGRLRAITSPGDAAAFEEYMAAREAHWVRRVARLEGLILDWYIGIPGDPAATNATAIRLASEARRIRAQREEGQHRKHPTGDYCVYCLSQWPCVEAGEQ